MTAILAAIILGSARQKQQSPAKPVPFTIERLSEFPLIQGRSPAGAALSPNGKEVVFGWNKTGDRRLDVYAVDPHSDASPKLIIDSSKFDWLPNQDAKKDDEQTKDRDKHYGGISSFTWAPDSSQFIFSCKGRFWTANADGSSIKPIIDASMGERSPAYSPNGKYIAMIIGQNVFSCDRSTGLLKQLTFVSKPQTQVDGFQWSPDSRNILISWSNSSKVGNATMMDFTKGRGTAVTISRDWNGDLSQDQQFGVVPAAGGLIKFLDGVPAYSWPSSSVWSPNGNSIAVGWFSGDFQEYTITVFDYPTWKSHVVYHEKAPANYESDWRPLVWTRDSKTIDFGTDISGGKFIYRSIFSVDPTSKEVKPVFVKDYAVGSFMRPKDSDKLVITTAGDSPLQTEIRVLDGAKDKTYDPIGDGYSSGKDFDSAISPLVSDDGKTIVTIASDRKQPWELYSILPSVRRLTTSQTADFAKIAWANVREVSFPGPEGATMHGLLFTSPNLDPTKKHAAVVSNIYGDSGKSAWGGFVENQLAMNHDMVVLALDFRASWGYGGAFDTGYYRKMGLIDADESADAAKYLSSLSYVDPKRLGIWGWSYGGFLTLMTMLTKPGVYSTGVAVAPVTDWSTYNEWYTRRRLGLYKDDKKIFEKTSPISYASGLQGNLLICHGIMDNNVLFENTAVLVEDFIKAGKFVDLMFFPKDDHSIGTDASRPYVMGKIERYLVGHLSN